jgi:beta-glucosidase
MPVERLEDAQLAIVRVGTPHEPLHPTFFFGRMQQEGRLDFREGDTGFAQITTAAARVPTIVAVNLSRPAILTNVRDRAHALVGVFGASDEALLDVLTGAAKAEGRLPFELPSSMREVEAQAPGQPHDTTHPLFPIRAGLGAPAGSAAGSGAPR